MASYRFRSEKYVSRGFKDFAISFMANPNTNDFGVVKNENAIKQAVKNLILTSFLERPFQPDTGSRIKDLMFEPYDPFVGEAMRNELRNVLERLEPRVEVTRVYIREEIDLNSLHFELDYKIVGEIVVKTVDFLLEKT